MLGAAFDVSAQFGEIRDELKGIRRQLAKNQVLRVHPARQATALSPVATFTSLTQLTQIGDPPGGQVWEVRRISFGMNAGGSITTPGTMIVFIGSNEVARTTTLPNFLTFSGYECLVNSNDNLYAVWVGGVLAANSSMIVDVSAAEYPVIGPVDIDA